ncbi:MAG: ester cyclase [Actinomycetota bacterium]
MSESAEVVGRKVEAFNAQDAEGLRAVYSVDCTEEVPGMTLRGIEEVVAYFSVFWEAFPDLRFTARTVVEQGPSVAVLGHCRGVHRGTLRLPGGDVAPTERVLDLAVSTFFEVDHGRIVSAHLTLDQVTMLGQLGLLPAPAAV